MITSLSVVGASNGVGWLASQENCSSVRPGERRPSLVTPIRAAAHGLANEIRILADFIDLRSGRMSCDRLQKEGHSEQNATTVIPAGGFPFGPGNSH